MNESSNHIETLEKIISDLALDKFQIGILEKLQSLKLNGTIKDYSVSKIHNDYHSCDNQGQKRADINLAVYLTKDSSTKEGLKNVIDNSVVSVLSDYKYCLPEYGAGKGYYSQKEIPTSEFNSIDITYYSSEYNKFNN